MLETNHKKVHQTYQSYTLCSDNFPLSLLRMISSSDFATCWIIYCVKFNVSLLCISGLLMKYKLVCMVTGSLSVRHCVLDVTTATIWGCVDDACIHQAACKFVFLMYVSWNHLCYFDYLSINHSSFISVPPSLKWFVEKQQLIVHPFRDSSSVRFDFIKGRQVEKDFPVFIISDKQGRRRSMHQLFFLFPFSRRCAICM